MGNQHFTCVLCYDESGTDGAGAGEPAYTQFEDLQLASVLGSGQFGEVKLAINRRTKDQFAVKVMQKARMKADELSALHAEVSIMSKIRHPHIIRFYEFAQDKHSYFIVMELVDGGELFERIVEKVVYSEREARDLVYVLLDAVHHMHALGIAHRDLKPENLLLASRENDRDVKLADLGFACECAAGASMNEPCGTPAYVAPEILNKEAYGLEVDMWSVGVIVFILLGGYMPFDDADGVAPMYDNIKHARYEFDAAFWEAVSADAKGFIGSLLLVDPAKRMSAAAALNHGWFTKHAPELASSDLSRALANLKKWNARRKLKGAARTVMASNRVKSMIGSLKAGK